tara:strand:+ start:1073 stop:1549 length:477 start_codon:yes stop_codon:yes gene_type:complete
MTKSQTSKKTSSSREAVSRYSGIASKSSVSSLTGDRYRTVEEFDPTKEHDEMLTRLAEIKSLKDELENEETVIKTILRKDLLSYQEDGDVPEIHHSQDEKLFVGFRTSLTYKYSDKLETRIEAHAKETKLIKNRKDAEVLNDIATIKHSKRSIVLYKP